MDCHECQYMLRCHPILFFMHRIGYPCNQGRYIKGKGPVRQATLPGTEEATA